ncbi:MAG: hypothetical protein ACJ780_29905 [Solirubrobacteraceae bacterium]
MSDQAKLDGLAVAPEPLTPAECMERAEAAAGALDLSALSRETAGDAVLLWRSETSEAWLNLWWQPRDTGYHDHDGSCVGVYVIEGVARNEPLVVARPREVREYRPGDRFSFPGTGIHRMEHDPGAVTIHVYSPPIRAIGHYEVEDGALRRRPGAPDEPSQSSPRLLAELMAGGQPAAAAG